MKRKIFFGAALLAALTLGTVSCSDDNNGTGNGNGDWTYDGDAADIDYTLANASD